VIVAARSSIRNIDLAKFQLRLAEQQVEINERRLEDLNLRDTTNPQQVVDAELDLVAARNDVAQSRTNLRNNILGYLLDTGQLRVAADGMLIPPAAKPAGAQPAGAPPASAVPPSEPASSR
jgi:hypothetical protein